MQVPFDKAHEILLSTCNLYKLPQAKSHTLLTELKSNQRNTSKMFTEMEMKIWSLQKRSNRLVKFGHSDTTLIIGMSLKFIDSDVTLCNILATSRDMSDFLREEVLKQALLRADQHRLHLKRQTLWL